MTNRVDIYKVFAQCLFIHFILVSSMMKMLYFILLVLIHEVSTSESENFFYSNNITEATNKFVAACSNATGSIEYFNHPMQGVNGELLQATLCVQGNPQARSIIFTISGTHGIEGYAGSMAQISLLRHMSSSILTNNDTRIINLHMINPYGASFISKENEQNADQLKNVAEYYTLNFDNPILQDLIDGIDLPNLWNQTVLQQAFQVFARLIAEHGEQNVNKALKTGQGKRPQGVAYFGPSKSWSSTIIEQVINKYLKDVDHILFIDWHTAVGDYGHWTYMPIDKESAVAFQRWIPDAPTESYDVVVPTNGLLPYSSLKTISGAKRVIRVFWEAGTYPTTPQTNAMFFLRLYCRFYSNAADPFCQQVIADTKEYFYPQQPDWKVQTYTKINDFLPRVLSNFILDVNNGITRLEFNLILILIILVLLF